MGSDVGQIFPTASLHRDHTISYALVCEKEISHMGKNKGNPDLVCEKLSSCIYQILAFYKQCFIVNTTALKSSNMLVKPLCFGNIRIYHECEDGMEKSVPRITD